MSREAMKLALEALGEIEWSNNSQWQSDRAKVAITALREALAEPQEKYIYGTPLLDAMTGKINEALDKKAENARELGLDYEPAQDSGIVTAGGSDPRTQRTWVGLDEKDFSAINQSCLTKLQAATSAESILKEKNT